MTQPTEPTEPTERSADPAADFDSELAASRQALADLTAERDAVVTASIRRRDRMLDEIDRLQAEVRRTRAERRRAGSSFWVRAARGIRRRLRAGAGRLTRGGAGTQPASHGPDRPGPAAAWDAANQFRSDLTDRLTGAVAPGRRPVRVAVLGRSTASSAAVDDPEDPDLVRAGLAGLGLDAVAYDIVPGPVRLDATTDVALLLDPSLDRTMLPAHLVTVAWLGDRPDPWLAQPRFDDLDIVLVADAGTRTRVETASAKSAAVAPDPATAPGAAAVRAALQGWLAAPRVAIHLPAPTWEIAAGWGDTPFGRSVQRAFERRGWRATVHVFDERDSPAAARADLSLHIFGLRAPAVRPGQPTILWIISHPDLVRRELCLAYDLIGVGSDAFLGYLRDWLGRDCPPLLPLHQATDPDRFYPEAGAPAHDLLFVGSSRDGRRPVIDDLAGTPHDLAVYGRNWARTSLDPRHLRGEWIPNHRLHQYYSNAAIVLSDTWADMRDEGFISNRPYDVLASGGFLVSDDVAGIDVEFDGAVPVYHDREDLWRLVDDYLAHPEARALLAERGRQIVLGRHTFGHRVDAILQAIDAGGADDAIPAVRAWGRHRVRYPAPQPPPVDAGHVTGNPPTP